MGVGVVSCWGQLSPMNHQCSMVVDNKVGFAFSHSNICVCGGYIVAGYLGCFGVGECSCHVLKALRVVDTSAVPILKVV
jgi:hypothetical protein